jgi:hypothetical protein
MAIQIAPNGDTDYGARVLRGVRACGRKNLPPGVRSQKSIRSSKEHKNFFYFFDLFDFVVKLRSCELRGLARKYAG